MTMTEVRVVERDGERVGVKCRVRVVGCVSMDLEKGMEYVVGEDEDEDDEEEEEGERMRADGVMAMEKAEGEEGEGERRAPMMSGEEWRASQVEVEEREDWEDWGDREEEVVEEVEVDEWIGSWVDGWIEDDGSWVGGSDWRPTKSKVMVRAMGSTKERGASAM